MSDTKGKISLTTQIINKIEEDSFIFFHDKYKKGYISTTGDGTEIIKLKSKQFTHWLSKYIWEFTKKIPTANLTRDVVQVLEAKAYYEGNEYNLENRAAKYKDSIWYDLGDGNVIFISKSGWQIKNNPPILFQKMSHQMRQVHPSVNGKIDVLCDFINLKTEEEKLLFLVYTVAAFIPGFPHPLLVFFGSKGAGKTTPQRLLKSLIDPSLLKTLTPPESLREFIQIASHHYFLFFDNLSYLPRWFSDALARASTGDGFSKRELYSDDEDVIYTYQRAIALNGISLVVQQPDLLERSILISLDRIPEHKRKTEAELLNAFELQKPSILGAIFDALVKTLQKYPSISLSKHPRMADFTVWGCAIAIALGYKQEEFLNAYKKNLERQNEEAIEANPLATVIIEFMSEKGDSWTSEPSVLHSELEKKAIEIKADTKAHEWPKSATTLWKKIQPIQTNLADAGIRVTRDEKARPRKIILEKQVDYSDGADGELQKIDIESQFEATDVFSSDISADGKLDISESTPSAPSEHSSEHKFDKERSLQQEAAKRASLLSHDSLVHKEKEFKKKVNLTDKQEQIYSFIYHEWFALRTEGEKRGLWSFIPTREE